MKKSALNLIIDVFLLLSMGAIVGIGLLIKFVLVPGTERWKIYRENVDLFFWGADRHQWGTVHLYIGFIFAALILLHIVLHWDMIIAIARRLIPNTLLRRTAATILLLLTLLLVGFAVLVKPQVVRRGFGGHRHGARGTGNGAAVPAYSGCSGCPLALTCGGQAEAEPAESSGAAPLGDR